VLWTERLFAREVTASPVLVGDDILAIAEDGEIQVFKAASEFQGVQKAKLGEGVYASPAVAGGRVYVRGTSHLFCFGK
jgi:outer membrane protein assembly factor BamB